MIDLRSDTVTLPSKEMKEFMFNSPLGDDVFGEDPSINALQKKASLLFEKEKDPLVFEPSREEGEIGLPVLDHVLSFRVIPRFHEEFIILFRKALLVKDVPGHLGNRFIQEDAVSNVPGKFMDPRDQPRAVEGPLPRIAGMFELDNYSVNFRGGDPPAGASHQLCHLLDPQVRVFLEDGINVDIFFLAGKLELERVWLGNRFAAFQ